MDFAATAQLPAAPGRVFAEVVDLTTYPHWLGIVHRVMPDGDGWLVDLGARVGPFARTKRVRMTAAEQRLDELVRFERAEVDGRVHSPWMLEVRLVPVEAGGTVLTMHLHYGGALWLPGLDLVLRNEVRKAGGRLAARLA
jgi:Polyketide cyclase / dehydrase and lipid transport